MSHKILIASDLHGDAVCTELLLKRFHEENAELCVLLGDLLYHGPRNDLPAGYAPKKVIELLNGERKHLLCVRGNCDTEVDQMVLNFPILSDIAVLFIDGRRWYLSHGHVKNAETPPPMQTGDLLLCGHTHVVAKEACEGFVYLNPGSLSIPKENTARGYILLDGDTFRFKTLDGEEYDTFEA